MSKIIYSDRIPGTDGNYNWAVRYDKDGGFVGISQTKDDGTIERVLLSPRQVKALLKFIERGRAAEQEPA